MDNQNMNLTLTPDTVQNPSFCSFHPENAEDKAKLYRAMTNPDKKVSDCINHAFDLADVYMEMVEMVQDETGEVRKVPRVVLFAADGVTYAATSQGIYNAIQRLSMVYGAPSWRDAPIPVIIRQIQMAQKRFYTLDVNV